jgi:mannosyl-oligosaccharide alpha-1,2-mannosidase
VFMMWRITGKREYQEAAWRMFQAVEKVSRTEVAAATITDITVVGEESKSKNNKRVEEAIAEEKIEKGNTAVRAQQMDSMESFWLAETLKYFYLVFEE